MPPGQALFLIIFSVGAFLLLGGGAVFAVWYGKRNRTRYDASFRQALEGLGLKEAVFYRRLYQYGRYKEAYISCHYSRVAKDDWQPLWPGSPLVILCRLKIPQTEGLRLHLTVTSEEQQGMRSLAGWENPVPRCYLGWVRDQSREESRKIFDYLSSEARAALLKLSDAVQTSCAVTVDWNTVMIGEDNAREMLDGDESRRRQLDLQIRMPVAIDSTLLRRHLDQMLGCVEKISHDLKSLAAA